MENVRFSYYFSIFKIFSSLLLQQTRCHQIQAVGPNLQNSVEKIKSLICWYRYTMWLSTFFKQYVDGTLRTRSLVQSNYKKNCYHLSKVARFDNFEKKTDLIYTRLFQRINFYALVWLKECNFIDQIPSQIHLITFGQDLARTSCMNRNQ